MLACHESAQESSKQLSPMRLVILPPTGDQPMKRALASGLGTIVFCLGILVLAADPQPPEGVLPLGADGKPLNLDFETGTLKDWTATGDAFNAQPIKGDKVATRRADMRSQHQGQYWIGGFEVGGDKGTGTL